MFYYSWPSWLVELGSGMLVVTLVQVFPAVPIQVFAAVFLSVIYESVFDPNGWSWTDIGQRAVGMLAGFLLWSLIRG